MLKKILLGAALLVIPICCAEAQPANVTIGGCAYFASPPTLSDNQYGVLNCDTTGALKIAGSFSQTGGTASNAADAVATSSTSTNGISFNYIYNGTTWDRARGDTTSGAWVNCKAGCAGGTASNASDAFATSSTNGQGLSFGYVYNGTTWDRLRGDTTNGAFVNVKTSVLPTGAATLAAQTTAQTSLTSIDGKTPALGQALAAASVPVVLTAAQLTTLTPLATIAATQSGTWNVTNISGTVSLPTGAATSANQATEITSLATIASNTGGAIPAGSNIIGNVRIDQTTAGTTNGVVVNSSALPTGAATSANQSTEITSLATLVTNSAAAIPAGSAIIGKVGIDQTTPGTTNAVQDAATSATGAAVPTKAQLAGARSGANIVEIIQADKSQAVTMSTATTTQMIALSGTTKTYITSYDIVAAGTTSVTIVYGTGANCGTGTTSLTGAYALTTTAQLSRGSGLGPVLVAPAGQAVCVTNSAAIAIAGSMSYTQF